MPKIKQYEERYAREEFWREVDGLGSRAGLKSNAALGGAMGLTGQCIGKYRQDLGTMQVKAIRKLVKELKPDPAVLLRLLGYTNKDIQAMAKQYIT